MEKNSNREIQILSIVLVIFYLVGLAGFIVKPDVFMHLTPFNLLLTLFLLLWPHRPKDGFFYLQLALIYISSFILEFMGVNTGTLFGPYSYGDALGLKIGNTPILIGVNWVLVSYSSLQTVQFLANRFKQNINPIVGALMAALLMVLLDLLIEPIAPDLNFWEFENRIVPLQNYTAWFFFGFAFCFWMIKGDILKNNPMGWRVYLTQFVFFMALNFIY